MDSQQKLFNFAGVTAVVSSFTKLLILTPWQKPVAKSNANTYTVLIDITRPLKIIVDITLY
jgi:hypothetical protein